MKGILNFDDIGSVFCLDLDIEQRHIALAQGLLHPSFFYKGFCHLYLT